MAFFIAYYFGGIYVATGVLMAGMAVLLAVDYLLHRRISPMHALSAVLVFGLGAATLLLHDKHFIQLKPTALFWVAGLAFLASFWIGKQTLTERALQRRPPGPGPGAGEPLAPDECPLGRVLRRCSARPISWSRKYASEQIWVYSKIGLTVITFVFAVAQVLYLVKRGEQVAPGRHRHPVQEPPPAV